MITLSGLPIQANASTICGEILQVKLRLVSEQLDYLDQIEDQTESQNVTSPFVLDLHDVGSSLIENKLIKLNASLSYANNVSFSEWSSWYPGSGTGTYIVHVCARACVCVCGVDL